MKAGLVLSLVVAATALVSPAFALSQSKHRSPSWKACVAHDTAPPWETPGVPASAPAQSSADEDSGCSLGRSSTGGLGLALLLFVGLCVRRRRALR